MGQPYDVVNVIAFGKAMRNPVILAAGGLFAFFVGLGVGVRQHLPPRPPAPGLTVPAPTYAALHL